LAEQAKQERDEFMRIINKQKEVEEQERRIEEEKRNMLKQHATGIRYGLANFKLLGLKSYRTKR